MLLLLFHSLPDESLLDSCLLLVRLLIRFCPLIIPSFALIIDNTMLLLRLPSNAGIIKALRDAVLTLLICSKAIHFNGHNQES